MAIGSAVQRGNSVNVYNERGVMLFSKVGELPIDFDPSFNQAVIPLLFAVSSYADDTANRRGMTA